MGLSVGVEEEFLLIDPAGRPVPAAAAVIEAADGSGVRLYGELTTAQVETNSAVCHGMRQLRSELFGLRSVAAAAASRAGARLVAAGTLIAGEPTLALSDTPRYRRMAQRYGRLVDEQSICGCHVHIGLPDRETAVQVSNHLRPWLPTLLALTANSAVHCGRDTGHASWRSIIASRWPCSGPPPYFPSAAHYDATVEMLIDTETIMDPGMIYWDVRPSAHLPTLEVRVSDVPSTVAETTLLATLVRGLVTTAVRDLDAGRTAPPVQAEVLRAAYWRSAHDGLTGQALDPISERPTTPRDMLSALLRHIDPDLEELGERAAVRTLLATVLTHGNGAIRQRRALAQQHAIADVVDQAVHATLQNTWPLLLPDGSRQGQPDQDTRYGRTA
ncbi:MAG: glutamate--cysteine ligase [Labedaea sp.]